MRYLLPVCLFVSAIALAVPAQAQGGSPKTGAGAHTATASVPMCWRLVGRYTPGNQNGNAREMAAEMPCSECPAGPTTTMSWCDENHNCRDVPVSQRCVPVEDYHGD